MFEKKPITITNDNPLIMNKLKVYPNKLEYENIRCNFIDIEHIGWYWSSQTVSIINTQDVRLSIYINGQTRPIHIQKSTMYVTPKIVSVYEFIAKKTFQKRLHFYTDQLNQAGGFTYDKCHIYSDGRIVSNNKTFSLSVAEVSAFEISIKQGGIFSPKVKISLDLDRDVVLTLIDFILKNPQDPSIYINNHKQQRESDKHTSYFLKDIVSLMAKLSVIDDYVSPKEIEIVKKFLLETMKLDKQEFAQAVKIFNTEKSSTSSFEHYAKSLYSRFHNDKNMLSAILDLLFSIAIADDFLSAEEELLLSEAESIFGIKGQAYSYFKNQSHTKNTNTKEYHLNILGLSLDATQDEIKREYKRLVMKFHPDKVHHLGDDFVREAEIKMKEINQAYDYLCR